MSGSSEQPWSDNPYAPQIPYSFYIAEKTTFAGSLIGAMFYGIVIVLFFQCMGALFDPANRTIGGVKWGLAAHSTAMFTFVTIYTALNLDLQSVSYIDNRAYPTGPFGYQLFVSSDAINTVISLMFFLNQWLADGLLLYRCYIIYEMDHWVVAFPSLMYIGSYAMGTALLYVKSRPDDTTPHALKFGISYFSLSLSLNILLTIMIVVRLILRSRDIRNVMGSPERTGGMYKTVVTILVESSALYAISSLLFLGPWAAGSYVSCLFFPILGETQVIAPLLITLRVANQGAFPSGNIVSGSISSIHFRSEVGSIGGNGALSDGTPTSSRDTFGESTGGLNVRV